MEGRQERTNVSIALNLICPLTICSFFIPFDLIWSDIPSSAFSVVEELLLMPIDRMMEELEDEE